MRVLGHRRALGHDAAQGGRGRCWSTSSIRRRQRCAASTRWCRSAMGGSKGYSTDGAGFVASLAAQGRRGRTVARSACSAPAARPVRSSTRSARAGAASIAVVNRSADRAGRPPALAGTVGVVGRPDDRAPTATSWSTPRRSAWAADELPFDRRPAARRSGRRRHRLPPARDGAAARPPSGRGARRSTVSGCSSTRPRCSSSCGPAYCPTAAVMRAAAERELACTRGQ